MSELPTSNVAASDSIGENLGIQTEEFLFNLVDDIKIIGNALIMDQSCFIWLGASDGPCVMGTLATAMPTRFSGMPVSSTLIHSDNDLSSDMAQRLAHRFKIQVFISWNLPEPYENHVHLIDKKLIEFLGKYFCSK